MCDCLSSGRRSLQHATERLVQFQLFDDGTLAGLLPTLADQFPVHPELECRREAHAVLRLVWDTRETLRSVPHLKVALLRGLCDPDESEFLVGIDCVCARR